MLELIRTRSTGLAPAEQRVARTILGNPVDVIHLSVTQLAEASGTSVGSVMRFCRSLELRGFQDLKLRLARESIPVEHQVLDEIDPGDGAPEVARKVLAGSAASLEEASRSFDARVLDAVVERLLAARRVLFVAVGTSAPLAGDIAYRLTTVGLPALAPADVHVQDVTARMLGPNDVCFAISHTGSTRETLAAVRTARAAGATTVALTSFASSPLTELTELALVAGSRETSYRIESMTSRIVHLAVLDAIVVLVGMRHPGAQAAREASADVLTDHRI
ncbi:MurR/RpiR family transcriptional regulator [Jiangella rhizosphaerae]|uniref:MurR/RpiR family transcriptional regulator n=2 Tax=Jiangella rhizosphaerae TaxID=2293569 RepID=A0A418KH08_9ACTN|nr:MurR/RpiR family transcriptional regulator [Jiangella rhizosphaerae]